MEVAELFSDKRQTNTQTLFLVAKYYALWF